MARYIYNISNIKLSGALQVSLSILNELKTFKNDYFLVLIPSRILSLISVDSYPANIEFKSVSFHTPFSVRYLYYLKTISDIELNYCPNFIISCFGPTYWRPKSIHIMGFALPHIIYPDSPFFNQLSFVNKLVYKLSSFTKLFYFKRDSDLLFVETNDVKNRLIAKLPEFANCICVVGNTYNHYFTNFIKPKEENNSKKNNYIVTTISSNFPHKNLKILYDVSEYLDHIENHDIIFRVTLSDVEYKKNRFHLCKRIHNLGVINPSECPSVYFESDVILLPSLLECFTANIPESFFMEKPLLVSDLSFMSSLCGNAALYFNPLDPEDIALKILSLKNDNSLGIKLITNGSEMLKKYPDTNNRLTIILDFIKYHYGFKS